MHHIASACKTNGDELIGRYESLEMALLDGRVCLDVELKKEGTRQPPYVSTGVWGIKL